jgi:hypothetical protein
MGQMLNRSPNGCELRGPWVRFVFSRDGRRPWVRFVNSWRALRLQRSVYEISEMMIQRREHLGFALEPGKPFRVLRDRVRKHLDCHLAIELGVFGPIDLAHPACTERREDLLRTESGSRSNGHSPSPRRYALFQILEPVEHHVDLLDRRRNGLTQSRRDDTYDSSIGENVESPGSGTRPEELSS